MAKKKIGQYVVPAIFIAVFIFALVFTLMQQRPVSEYPDQLSPLNSNDFVIANTNPPLEAGIAYIGDVQLQFPGGKMLGRSGVYRPANVNAIFTFTRKTNILNKVDITGPGLSTTRSIAVNDSFDKVIDKYGDGFIRSYYKSDPQTFDAIYGENQCIVFNVKDNIVKKIVIMHEIDTTI